MPLDFKMEMQKKDLHSLKLLYTFLQTTAIDLDEGARLLLKNLLDSATSKILSTGQSISSNSHNPINPNLHIHNSPKLEEQLSIRKKRCRVCQQSNLQTQTQDECSIDFSKQVSNSIKLIESTLLSLQFSSQISNPIKLEPASVSTRTVNSQENRPSFLLPGNRNDSPAYHYVHGLRLPSIRDSIRDNHGAQIANPRHKTLTKDSSIPPVKNIGVFPKPRPSIQSQLDCASSHNTQNVMKPMLLNYSKKTFVKQKQKKSIPYRQDSDVSSSSFQGSDEQSIVSSPTSSSYSSRSNSKSETSEMTPGTSPEESTSYSSVNNTSESYRGSSKKMHRKSPDKPTGGRLRRLKNKLQLIFHHHHHHHHHHNHGEKGETSNKKDHRSSMWKHLGTIFHHKEKEKMCEKQAVRKLKTVTKKQAGQFQTLVKGMARHVKQSKKSKVPKGRIPSHRDNKQWWKLFHGPRGRGVKLPKGGRIRLQVKGKKPQLRAPKTFK